MRDDQVGCRGRACLVVQHYIFRAWNRVLQTASVNEKNVESINNVT